MFYYTSAAAKNNHTVAAAAAVLLSLQCKGKAAAAAPAAAPAPAARTGPFLDVGDILPRLHNRCMTCNVIKAEWIGILLLFNSLFLMNQRVVI